MRMNKAQQRKLKELYGRSTQRRTMSYRQYRRTVMPMFGCPADMGVVRFNNMTVGIDREGNGNS